MKKTLKHSLDFCCFLGYKERKNLASFFQTTH